MVSPPAASKGRSCGSPLLHLPDARAPHPGKGRCPLHSLVHSPAASKGENLWECQARIGARRATIKAHPASPLNPRPYGLMMRPFKNPILQSSLLPGKGRCPLHSYLNITVTISPGRMLVCRGRPSGCPVVSSFKFATKSCVQARLG